jgi:hypothetical protein
MEGTGECRPSIEHLKDKWASPYHQKIEEDSNKVAACWKCNNTLGNRRNRIARSYYQRIIDDRKIQMKAASTQSNRLYKLFGPVPQELFAGVTII